MKLLRDIDIVAKLSNDIPIILNVDEPKDWFSEFSPIRPCSIDLHIGKILLPSEDVVDNCKEIREEISVILPPGATALVKTRETMNLPSNIAGVVFPPAHLSSRGIMLINPGHIDPGSKTELHACIINMGRTPHSLRQNDKILRMMLFEVSENPKQVNVSPLESRELLNALSKDFLNVEGRARETAQKTLKDAEYQVKLWSIKFAIVPVLAAILVALITGLFSFMKPNWEDKYNQIDKRVAVLEMRATNIDIEKRLHTIEGRIDSFQAAGNQKNGQDPSTPTKHK